MFPILTLDPAIVSDAIEGGEGALAPMLSITGLLLKDLQPHITETNKYLSANSELFVSLHNGMKTFVEQHLDLIRVKYLFLRENWCFI